MLIRLWYLQVHHTHFKSVHAPEIIAACNTIEKLLTHIAAGGAFPANAVAGSRILSVQAEARKDTAPMMVMEEDEDDFRALMDRIQQSDSNVTFEVRPIS
jgi:hypothetical protein